MVGFLGDDEVDDAWVVGAPVTFGWPVKVNTMWLGSSGDVAQRLLHVHEATWQSST